MNTLQIIKELKKIALNQDKYNYSTCEDIINVIIKYYNNSTFWNEKHCIKCFIEFVNTGCLKLA